jgi:hypothetical protein
MVSSALPGLLELEVVQEVGEVKEDYCVGGPKKNALEKIY